MFDYKIKIEDKAGNIFLEEDFEILVWYYGPRVLVNRGATTALIWCDDSEEHEKWFLSQSPTVILEYIMDKSTMRDIVLKGKTSLFYYDFKTDKYIFEKNFKFNSNYAFIPKKKPRLIKTRLLFKSIV